MAHLLPHRDKQNGPAFRQLLSEQCIDSLPSFLLMVIPCIRPPKVALILVSLICENLIFYTIMQWKGRCAFPIISKTYSETCVKRPLSKRPKIAFQDQLSLNVGQKYCRMLQGKHSALLSIFIYKLPFVIKIFVLSIFEWPFYTDYNVLVYCFIDSI